MATTNNSNFETLEITKLPWTLEFTAKSGITSVIIQANGTGGVAGQTASLKTYVGGKEVATATGSALSGGILILSNNQYFLK